MLANAHGENPCGLGLGEGFDRRDTVDTEYPKIETLYDRDERFKVVPKALRLPEFALPRSWAVTEKIDGTNVRVCLRDDGSVAYTGRTDTAQLPAKFFEYLANTLPADRVRAAFPDCACTAVTIYGEGYGAGIQRGGIYRPNMALRIFDALVGEWWLEPANVQDVANKLGLMVVPYLGTIGALPASREELLDILHGGQTAIGPAEGGCGGMAEGIVARTVPLLLTRGGERLMWKLKLRDFAA